MQHELRAHFVLRGLTGRISAFDFHDTDARLASLRALVQDKEGIYPEDQILICEGRNITSEEKLVDLLNKRSCDSEIPLTLSLRLRGGKGGFGSLLRSQKAKKKTTNFGSARTLDGRRIRDIEREQLAAEAGALRAQVEEEARKKREELRAARELEQSKKLNSLMAVRKELVEGVANAVEEGVVAARALRELERKEKEALAKLQKKKETLALSSMPGFEDLSSSSKSGNDSSEESESSVDAGIDQIVADEKADVETLEQPADEKRNNEEQESRGIKRAREEEEKKILDLSTFSTPSELEQLGLEKLKEELSSRGLKIGGSLSERAQRLFSVKDLTVTEIPTHLLASNVNKKQKKE